MPPPACTGRCRSPREGRASSGRPWRFPRPGPRRRRRCRAGGGSRRGGGVRAGLTAEMDLPPPDTAHWRDQVKDLGRRLGAPMHRHPDSARITVGVCRSAPSEWLCELLTPVGIPDRVIAFLSDMDSLSVGAYAFEERLGPASPAREDLPPERIAALFRDHVLPLPPERFPLVHRAIDDMLAGDADARFGLAFGRQRAGTGAVRPARRPGPSGGDGGATPPPRPGALPGPWTPDCRDRPSPVRTVRHCATGSAVLNWPLTGRTALYDALSIQSGGGTGPMKPGNRPRAPGRRRGANSCRPGA